MPEIVYRRLCMDDIDIFIQMRLDQLAEEGAKQDSDLTPRSLRLLQKAPCGRFFRIMDSP